MINRCEHKDANRVIHIFEQIGGLTRKVHDRITRRRVFDRIQRYKPVGYAAQQVGNTNQQEYKRQYENYFGKFDFGQFNLVAALGCDDQLFSHQFFKLDYI